MYESEMEGGFEFLDRAEKAIGKRGLDYGSLCFWGSHDHLPAELYNGLTKEEADTIVREQSGDGIVMESHLTSELTGLRHRADEVWATRSTETYCFTEIDGLICSLGAINARENVANMKNRFPDAASWEIEKSENHDHVFCDGPDGDYIVAGEMKVERLKTALRQAYPDVAFTISIRPGSIISFWQTNEDSPKGSYIPDKKNESGESWCHKCRKNQKHKKIDYVDDRHPNAEWGKCQVCGEKIIAQTCVKLIHI